MDPYWVEKQVEANLQACMDARRRAGLPAEREEVEAVNCERDCPLHGRCPLTDEKAAQALASSAEIDLDDPTTWDDEAERDRRQAEYEQMAWEEFISEYEGTKSGT